MLAAKHLQQTGIALALAVAAAPAPAEVIVQGFDFVLGGSVFAPIPPVFGIVHNSSDEDTGFLTFDFFDPVKGTLNSAKWVLTDGQVKVDLAHSARLTAPLTFPPILIFEFALKAGGHVLGQIGGPFLHGTGESFSIGAGQDTVCGQGPIPPVGELPIPLPGEPGCIAETVASLSHSTSLTVTDLAELIGVGTFKEEIGAFLEWSDRVDVVAQNGSPIFAAPPPIVEGDFAFTGRLELIYEYTPAAPPPPTEAPLPGTALLLGAGLLGLGAVRRRT